MAGDSEELLMVMASAAMTAAQREGIDQASAQRLVSAVYQSLRRHYGCERVYIPAMDKSARDRAILAGLAVGENKTTIAKRVGVHPRTVARVAQRRARRSIAPSDWEL